jgi:hypothetical protein
MSMTCGGVVVTSRMLRTRSMAMSVRSRRGDLLGGRGSRERIVGLFDVGCGVSFVVGAEFGEKASTMWLWGCGCVGGGGAAGHGWSLIRFEVIVVLD